MESRTYINDVLFPTLLVIVCPIAAPLITSLYHLNVTSITWSETITGNALSWIMIIVFITWAYVLLKISSAQYFGPTTHYGFTPSYQNNGWFYYVATNSAFFLICGINTSIAKLVYSNVQALTATLSLIGLILTIYLWYNGKFNPQHEEKLEKLPLIVEIYNGIELHPRIFGVDVKQLTNSRIGMMGWQLLINAYCVYSYEKYDVNYGIMTSYILQTVYIAKYFWAESAYFITHEIVSVRAGFYSTWGCLVFLPIFYASTSLYFVTNPPEVDLNLSYFLLMIGLVSIYFTYLIDHEREIFKLSNGTESLWSKNPKVIKAEYIINGKKYHSKLLVSGLWGICRHLNYFFEITAFLSWSLPGYKLSIGPFVCPTFVIIVLLNRTFRDDTKCLNKYGEAWRKYCELVKYKIIPYVF